MTRYHRMALFFVALILMIFVGGCDTPPDETPKDSLASAVAEVGEVRGERQKQSDGFSNIKLQTQFGETVEFYEDLIRDKAVIVNFFYSTCAKACPGTSAQIAKMIDDLGPSIGEDITMLSLSIDPKVDNPARMKEYWKVFGSKPGWLMLTGDEDEINRVRRQMGVYDLDPVIDADKTQHAGILTFGNDRTNRWAALPAFMHRERMLETILHTTKDSVWGRSASTKTPVTPFSNSAESFKARGIVRGAYPDRGEILVEHGDIPGLMMAMTMMFSLTDSQLLEEVKVGDTIDFEVQSVDGSHEILSLSVDRLSPSALGDEENLARRTL